MKRRRALQSLLGLPAITALPAAAQSAAPEKPAPRSADETPKLAMTNADAAATPQPLFFSPEQFRTLERLCETLVPAADPKPGATEAGVAPFLDFLIGRSPSERQTLYQRGLEQLDAGSRARFHVPFEAASAAQIADLLAPLRAPWTFAGPSDAFAGFLIMVKDDTLRATINSREWAAASTGRRGASGIGTYWYSLE